MTSTTKTAVYTYGHYESSLRSHSWRTATNSASHLLPYLTPSMTILDIGCGPGTISIDFAENHVPAGHVTAIEPPFAGQTLDQARSTAAAQGVKNITFEEGDIMNLEKYPDNSFDVVHAHQVLQHIADPIQALKEMKRVSRNIVACRESDAKGFVWYPQHPQLDEWVKLYYEVARANGGEPDAGRRVAAWAMEAGFERAKMNLTAGTWCYSTPAEIQWWSGLWADRTMQEDGFLKHAVGKGLATREDLEKIAAGWKEWKESEQAWFALLHGEMVARV